jgi:hypothetical protein
MTLSVVKVFSGVISKRGAGDIVSVDRKLACFPGYSLWIWWNGWAVGQLGRKGCLFAPFPGACGGSPVHIACCEASHGVVVCVFVHSVPMQKD